MKTAVTSIVAALLFLAFWYSVLKTGLVSPAVLAYPGETLRSLPAVLSPSGNLADVWATVWRSLTAFLIAVPTGIGLGVAVFALQSYRGPVEFVLDFLRSTPATALVPVFLIIFGVGNAGKVGAGVLSAALVIALATLTGLEKRNATRLGVTRLMRLSRWEHVLFVDLPEAAPHLLLGLRTGISLALILVVVSEMLIGASSGLGRVIYDMQYSDDKGRLYAAIVVVGTIGFLYNRGLRAIDRLLWWRSAE